MAQPDFAEALLRACHAAGFNTAIETTACVSRDIVARLIPHIDHVMMDIKHMDSDKHKAFTVQPNEQILENARWIAENAKHIVIRVPFVPTFNDTVEEITAIAKFAESLPNEQILENARWIAENAKHFVVRVPVVPTFNDTVEEITAIARFAESLPNVHELHLLPYHRLGQDKYEGLGREYTLAHITPPTKEHMEELLAAAEHASGGIPTKLRVQIGG